MPWRWRPNERHAVLRAWTMLPLPAAERDVLLVEALEFAADTATNRLPTHETLPPRYRLLAIRCCHAWVGLGMLLYCACPRAQHVLRIFPPALNAAFAAEHDHCILSCLAQLLQVEASFDSPLPALVARRAHQPLWLGGLGLRSASAHVPATYLASWADSRAIAGRDRPFSDGICCRMFEGLLPTGGNNRQGSDERLWNRASSRPT